MKRQELKLLLSILIDTYLVSDIGGAGYRILNDDLDIRVNYFKPEWISVLMRAYKIESVVDVSRRIIAKLCAEKNTNPLLKSELNGFIINCYSQPNGENIKELILKMYAIHIDLDQFKPKKTTIIQTNQSAKQYVPIFTIDNVTPYDIIPIYTKKGTFAINVQKFMKKFGDVDLTYDTFKQPEKIFEIRKYIEESSTEDQLNEIFIDKNIVSEYL